ncbi:MAG: GTP-binding protein [Bacteroidota bacterium]
MDLLRLFTAGSVDDGKSTLIGRLLYDSKSIFEDQLESIQKTSERRGDEHLNLALLTDGLRAEREQGITIDVAYRYFSTPKRKFIIADAPGHVQYTRNMVTGASTCDLGVILIDARNGIVEQTKRHSFLVNLLGIKHIVVCINKMDLVDFDEARYNEIVKEYRGFASKLQITDIRFIPISALHGDNVVEKSEKMPWFEGAPFLYTLENIHFGSGANMVDCRFPVQYVLRPQSAEYPDYRAYAGQVSGGIFKPGDDVILLPSGFTSTIKSIDTADGPVDKAFYPMSVAIQLTDDLDLSRGGMLARPENQPEISQDLDMMISWFNEKPLQVRGKYSLRHTTQNVRCIVKEVQYKINIHTLHRLEEDRNIGMNDIGRIKVRTTKPLFYDTYSRNRLTGSVILVDEFTNETVGAGMLL